MMKLKKYFDAIVWRIRRYILIFFGKNYLLWQKLGFHIIPNNYSSPIPDTRKINDKIWTQNNIIGVDFNDKKQIKLLYEFSKKFKDEYNSFPLNKTSVPSEFYLNNSAFGSVDAEVLYCMIRFIKPKLIYEIGSGYSTFLSAQALIKNKDENKKESFLTAFEPYPNNVLLAGFPGLHKLVQNDIQDIPISEFDKLSTNDILFIDSSHVLKIGNDVYYEFLELIPRIKKGVIIHIHDIFFPYEYPKNWIMKEYRYYTEQYLLQSFLSFNDSFEVLWAGSYMHHNYSSQLKQAFNSYNPNAVFLPGSIWIRRIK